MTRPWSSRSFPRCATGSVEDESTRLWPPVDIYRTTGGWLLKFELAGVRPEEIEVRLDGARLTVRGVRRDQAVFECQHAWSMEIVYNRFERSIMLPAAVERSQVSCDYRDGMLLVRIETEAPQS